jgi:hypothetical protein
VQAQAAVIRIGPEDCTEYWIITHRNCQELRCDRQLGVASVAELDQG